MSTVAEIRAALSQLTNHDLQELDAAVRQQFRMRKIGILYDDAYGIWTEEDQASAGAEVFALMEQEEQEREQS